MLQKRTDENQVFNDNIGDDTCKKVPPFLRKDTAQELDNGFFQVIEQPIKQTSQLFANMGSSLLWKLFREEMTKHKGFFLNLANFKSETILVG
jgi:hypothetical protein